MSDPEFGELAQQNSRDFWPHEAADFTPWLARPENMARLSQVVGLELEVESVEQPVGPFNADIVCTSLGEHRRVVIENQLERSDHDHLGKMLTYAAGLDDVSTVIWVAPKFTDEHRAALDWLNSVTTDEVRFFGIGLEVWQIGESLPAPRFNLVSQPNDWSKTLRSKSHAGLSDGKLSQLDFWAGFGDYATAAGSTRSIGKPQAQNWMTFGIGRSGLDMSAVAARGDAFGLKPHDHLRVEIVSRGSRGEALYEQLEQRRPEIDAAIGELATWYRPESGHQYRIYVSRPADVADRDLWPEFYEWLLVKLDLFEKVFRPIVKDLTVE